MIQSYESLSGELQHLESFADAMYFWSVPSAVILPGLSDQPHINIQILSRALFRPSCFNCQKGKANAAEASHATYTTPHIRL